MNIRRFTREGKEHFFVHVSHEEALNLIRSLTEQMIYNNSNMRRLESYTMDGDYFTVAVDEEVKETIK